MADTIEKAEVVNKDFVIDFDEVISNMDDPSTDVGDKVEGNIEGKSVEQPKNEDATDAQANNESGNTASEGEAGDAGATEETKGGESSFEVGDIGNAESGESTVPENKQTPQSEDWKAAIKKVDYKEVAKELGFDPFILELNEHIKNGGSAQDYLFAKIFDWDKVPDERLLKEALQSENPSLTPEQINKIFNRKYSQNESDSEDDKEMGDIMKKMDADKIRTSRKAEQQKFKLPDPKQVELPDDVKEKIGNVEKFVAKAQETRNHILENEATKNLHTGKRVAVELPDGSKFNFNIDKPEVLTNILTNGQLWQKVTTDSEGRPNVALLQKMALYALNEKKFIGDIYTRGKDAGKAEMVTENRNASRPNRKLPDSRSEKVEVKGDISLSL